MALDPFASVSLTRFDEPLPQMAPQDTPEEQDPFAGQIPKPRMAPRPKPQGEVQALRDAGVGGKADPFAPAVSESLLRSAAVKDRATAQAAYDQTAQLRAAAETQAAVQKQQKAEAEQAQKEANASREAYFKTQGIRHYTDAFGNIVPETHEDGAMRYAVGETGRSVVHRGTDSIGGDYRIERDDRGRTTTHDENQYRVFPDEPGVIYRGGRDAKSRATGPGQFDRTGWQKHATVDEALASDHEPLRAAGELAAKQRDQKLANVGLEALKQREVAANSRLDSWRSGFSAKQARMKELDAEMATLAPQAQAKSGGFLGIGSDLTPAAMAAQKRLAQLQTERAKLEEGPRDLNQAMEQDPDALAARQEAQQAARDAADFSKFLDLHNGNVTEAARQWKAALGDRAKDHPALAALAQARTALGMAPENQFDPEARKKQLEVLKAHPNPSVQGFGAELAALDAEAQRGPGERADMADREAWAKGLQSRYDEVNAKIEGARKAEETAMAEQQKADAKAKAEEAQKTFAAASSLRMAEGASQSARPESFGGALKQLPHRLDAVTTWLLDHWQRTPDKQSGAEKLTALATAAPKELVRGLNFLLPDAVSILGRGDEQAGAEYDTRTRKLMAEQGLPEPEARKQALSGMLKDKYANVFGGDEAEMTKWQDHARLLEGETGGYGVSPATGKFVVSEKVWASPEWTQRMLREVDEGMVPGVTTPEQKTAFKQVVEARQKADQDKLIAQAKSLPGWADAVAQSGDGATDAEVYTRWKDSGGGWSKVGAFFKNTGAGALGLIESGLNGSELWVRDKADAVGRWADIEAMKQSPEDFAKVLADFIDPDQSVAAKMRNKDPRAEGFLASTGDVIGSQLPGWLMAFALSRVPGGKAMAKKTGALSSLLTAGTYGLSEFASNYAEVYDSLLPKTPNGQVDEAAVTDEMRAEAHKAAMRTFKGSMVGGASELLPLQKVFNAIPAGKMPRVMKVLKEAAMETAQEAFQNELDAIVQEGVSGGLANPKHLTDKGSLSEYAQMGVGMALPIGLGVLLKARQAHRWMAKNGGDARQMADAVSGLTTAWDQYSSTASPDVVAFGGIDPAGPVAKQMARAKALVKQFQTGVVENPNARFLEPKKSASMVENQVEALNELQALNKEMEGGLAGVAKKLNTMAKLAPVVGELAQVGPEQFAAGLEARGIAPEIAAQYVANPDYVARQKALLSGLVKSVMGQKDLLTQQEQQALGEQVSPTGDSTAAPTERVYEFEGQTVIEERARKALLRLVPSAATLFGQTEEQRKLDILRQKADEEAAKADAEKAKAKENAKGQNKEPSKGGGPAAGAPSNAAGATQSPIQSPAPEGTVGSFLSPQEEKAVGDLTKNLVEQGMPEADAQSVAQGHVAGTNGQYANYDTLGPKGSMNYIRARMMLSDDLAKQGYTWQDGKIVRPANATPGGKPAAPPPLARQTVEPMVREVVDAAVKKFPILANRISFTRTEGAAGMEVDGTDATIVVDLDKLTAQLGSLDGKHHRARLEKQLGEEIKHFATFEALRRAYVEAKKAGGKESWIEFRNRQLTEVWQGLSQKARAKVVQARKMSEKEPEFALGAEAVRMILDVREDGSLTEEARLLVQGMSAKTIEFFRNLFASLKKMLADPKHVKEHVQALADATAAVIAEWEKHHESSASSRETAGTAGPGSSSPGHPAVPVASPAPGVEANRGQGDSASTAGGVAGPADQSRIRAQSPPQSAAGPAGNGRGDTDDHNGAGSANAPGRGTAVAGAAGNDAGNAVETRPSVGPRAGATGTASAGDVADTADTRRLAMEMDLVRLELRAMQATMPNMRTDPAGYARWSKVHDAMEREMADLEEQLAAAQAKPAPKPKPAEKTPTVDTAAQAAATSPKNDLPQPTPAQKEAGNYQMGHALIGGLDVSIENPVGSVRSGKDKDGETWSITMRAHYGYIKGTEGKDGDHVDVFLAKATPTDYAGPVFIVDQINPDGSFDEHKVVIGVKKPADARALYLSHYTKGWTGLGALTEMPWDQFKDWVQSGQRRKPVGQLLKSDKSVDQGTEPLPAPKSPSKKEQLRAELEAEVAKNEAKKARKKKAEAKKAAAAQAALTPEQKAAEAAIQALKDFAGGQTLKSAPLHPGITHILPDGLSEPVGSRLAAGADQNALDIPASAGGVNSPSFSLAPAAQRDAEYLAAVEAGDMEKAQRMVDEAAKAAGLIELYHGSSANEEVKTFEDRSTSSGALAMGIYMSPDIETAQGYGKTGRYWVNVNLPGFEEYNAGLTLEQIAAGKTTPVEGKSANGAWKIENGTVEVVVRKASQIKSADPVTRDAAGNIIPLSQRFDSSKDSNFAGGQTLKSAPLGTTPSAELDVLVANVGTALYAAGFDTPKKFVEKLVTSFGKGKIGPTTIQRAWTYTPNYDPDKGIPWTKLVAAIESQLPDAPAESSGGEPMPEPAPASDPTATQTGSSAETAIAESLPGERPTVKPEDPDWTTPAERFSVYRRPWQGEMKWFVQGEEGKRGFGDYIFDERSEAEREAAILKQRAAERAESLKEIADREAMVAEAERKIVEKYAPFTAGMSPMNRGRAIKALRKVVMNRGLPMTIGDLVQRSMSKGFYSDDRGAERRIIHPDGRIFSEDEIGKIGMDYAEFLGAQPSDQIADSVASPQSTAAAEILKVLNGPTDLTWNRLFEIADAAWSGTQANGAYTVKDAYDALELAVNRWIESQGAVLSPNATLDAVETMIRRIDHAILTRIPTQTKRTAEADAMQQFSTPPHFALVANWAANIKPGDVVLEPSAGIGGLGVFAKNAGATVIANELSPRRREFLKEMGFPHVFGENAEHLFAILEPKIQAGEIPRPTLVVMNPPFSNAAKSGEKGNTMIGAQHIEQALKLLPEGGRLVAIVGEGMGLTAPTFRGWWNTMRRTNTIRANIFVDGRNYAKYGTTFSNRLLVIDKGGLTTDANPVKVAEVEKISELPTLLEEIRNDRPSINAPAGTRRLSPVGPNAQEGSAGNEPAVSTADPVAGNESAGGDRPAGSGTKRRPAERRPAGDTGRTGGVSDTAGVGERDTAGSGSADSRSAAAGDTAGVEAVEIGRQDAAPAPLESDDDIFARYRPAKLKIAGSQPHPAPLVETAAMASVEAPDPTYQPRIPKDAIAKGMPSDVQLEAIVYAGQAHEQLLPNGERRGFFIGDGTGVGKGIEIASIFLDNWNQGRKKGVWISKTPKLIKAAKRDAGDVGINPAMVVPLNKVKSGEAINAPEGIYFAGYGTLAKGHNGVDKDGMIIAAAGGKKSRLQQLVDWLGPDFDGVIAFDEAHKAGNAIGVKSNRGMTKPSAAGIAVVDIQKLLPKARIVYVSATGATELTNLSYADRLGLWGPGTSFSTKLEFFQKLAEAGLSGMEIVARDMKALGGYMARSISYKGVGFRRLTHALRPEQRTIYDKMAGAWNLVFQNMQSVLDATGAGNNANARSAASSAFWGAQQRFFNQFLIALQIPSLITDMEATLEAGKSAVLQLVNTSEAQQGRAVAAKLSESEEGEEVNFEDLNVTPREILLQYVDTAFPINKFEAVQDPNNPERTLWVPATDSEGKPIVDPEAVAKKNELLAELSLLAVPDAAMNQIIDHFGYEKVAEVTGRSERLVWTTVKGQRERVLQKRAATSPEVEAQEFQDGKRRILIFSDAGGTGFSFHADNRAKNQQQRMHYVVQPGWKAAEAMQGLGRSHRSNQATQPEFVLVETDIKGHRRFISTIARRLAQLGALTTGERASTGQGLFSESDNLESDYANNALAGLIRSIYRNEVPGWDTNSFGEALGFAYERTSQRSGEKEFFNKLVDSNTGSLNLGNLPTIPQFLNRLLGMSLSQQNDLFDLFDQKLKDTIESAKAAGTYDPGTQSFEASKSDLVSIKQTEDKLVYEHPTSTAKTRLIVVDVETKTHVWTWNNILNFFDSKDSPVLGYAKNIRSGKVYAYKEGPESTSATTGEVTKTYRMRSVTGHVIRPRKEVTTDRYTGLTKEDAEKLWAEQVATAPKTVTEPAHFLVGALVPIWDRLRMWRVQVFRFTPEGKNTQLGVLVPESEVEGLLIRLGAGNAITPDKAFNLVLNEGAYLKLANGWTVSRVRVSAERRIEVKGMSYQNRAEFLSHIGGIEERISWDTRYFLPTDPGKGLQAMGRLLAKSPVAELNGDPIGGSNRPIQSAPLTAGIAGQPPEEQVVSTWRLPFRALGIAEDKLNKGAVDVARAAAKLTGKAASVTGVRSLVSKMAGSAPGQLVGSAWAETRRQLAPMSVLPRETAAKLLDTKAAMTWGKVRGGDLHRLLKLGSEGGTSTMTEGFVVPAGANTAENHRLMGQYFRGSIPIDQVPAELRPLAEQITEQWTDRGRQMVEAGLMKQSTFDQMRGQYFPRYFFKNEAEEKGAMGWMRSRMRMVLDRLKPQLTSAYYIYRIDEAGKPKLDKRGIPQLLEHEAGRWRFQSAAQRNAFFDKWVKTQTIAAVQKTGRRSFTEHDLERLELADPNTKALVRALEQKIRAGWQMGQPADEETLQKMGLIEDLSYVVPRSLIQMDQDIALANLFRDLQTHSSVVSDVKIGEDWKQMPEDPRWGALAGKWVDVNLHDQLIAFHGAPSFAAQVYDGLLSRWKKWKTVYNPATHVRNVIGNLFFADLAGVGVQNPDNWRFFYEAVQAMRGQHAWLKPEEMVQMGLIGSDFSMAELKQAFDEIVLPKPEEMAQGNAEPIQRLFLRSPGKWSVDKLKAGLRGMEKAYQAEDQIFKVAAYLKQRGNGVLAKDAAQHVAKWFPTYSNLGESTLTRFMRRFTSPFLSFMIESWRIGGIALAEQPITLAKWIAMPSLLTALAAFSLGLDDDDLEAIQKDMRGQVFGHPWFSVLLPWTDDLGRPMQLDLTNVIPYADALGKRGDFNEPDALLSSVIKKYFLSGPTVQLAIAWGFGRNPYTDKEFKQADMTPGEVLREKLAYTMALLAPPLTPGVGTADPVKWVTGQERTGRFLQERSRPAEVARQLGGVDVRLATPNPYRMAEDFRQAQGLPEPPAPGDSTAKSRTRASIYAALVNGDVDALAKSLQEFRSKTGQDIRGQQDIERLFFLRRPLNIIDSDPATGRSARQMRQLFLTGLSDVERQTVDRAEAEWLKAKDRAPLMLAQARAKLPPFSKRTAPTAVFAPQ